ncbi:MAG: hypothetical protein RIS47_258, partial [Bacteroidota bacterium]
MSEELDYSEDSIRTLDWKEHIRKRPGMYIGKLGDGSAADDGIYILIKEVLDNSIDEFMMGYGKKLKVEINDLTVTIRDYGRGIPLGKLIDVASKMNTGAKYDSKVFKKSVGLNGVGIKAANALSDYFCIRSVREGEVKEIIFNGGNVVEDKPIVPSQEQNGVEVIFRPDVEIFGKFQYLKAFVETMLRNYTYLNTGLTIYFNGAAIVSRNGLLDLLEENMSAEVLYPPIRLKDPELEIALTHANQYGEEYYTFVNGQNTTQGGSHLLAFREAVVKTIRDFFGKDYDVNDIRQGMVAAVSIKIEEPVFESQTKTKLGSKNMSPEGISVRQYVMDMITKTLDDYLHKNTEVAKALQTKIVDAE